VSSGHRPGLLRRVVRWPTVQWFFTALLILASAGTVGYAAYLLRRLFTTPPADGGAVEE
jgi:hypothetical protein